MKSQKCLQIYFYDPALQAELRLQHVRDGNTSDREMDRSIFEELQRILAESNNSYLQSFLEYLSMPIKMNSSISKISYHKTKFLLEMWSTKRFFNKYFNLN
jgi:hypothetical protein